jgi:hypothetical protein
MAGYIGAAPVPQATQHRQAFTATAAQTSFATAGYTSQFIDVYLNGIKLAGEDYTATNGSDIVLAIGAATGDILEYVAYTPFEVADQTFTGTTTLTDSGAAPLVVNRTTSDGDLVSLQYAGTAIGSLKSRAGVVSSIVLDPRTTTGAGAGLTGTAQNAIAACDAAGATIDATNDLGVASVRWKDLYLSGGAYLGGTAAANKLDDYEEGTWTPTIEFGNGTTGITYTAQAGYYTKVGNLVVATCYVQLANKGSSVGSAELEGLPFTSSNETIAFFPATFRPRLISFADMFIGYVFNNTTTLGLEEVTNAGIQTALTNADFQNGSNFMVSVSYRTLL